MGNSESVATNNVKYDKDSGNFIVTVQLTPEQYTRSAQEQTIANINNVDFDQQSGKFCIAIYMTPDEYGDYIKDNTLPKRYFSITDILDENFCVFNFE